MESVAVNKDAVEGSISPLAQLRVQADRGALCSASEHGVGYHQRKDGKSELIFSDVDGQQYVAIPTRLTEEQFSKVMEQVLPLPETRFMLHELAKAYSQRTPIMLEGGTALGKTFVVNTFAKLLYGARAEIPDFYCSGQTDVSELMGKYVPAGITQQDNKRIDVFLKSDGGVALKAELQKEGGGRYEVQELHRRAVVELGIPFEKGSFEFQLGVLPKAMTATMDANGELRHAADGPGVMLHVQEAGLAAPGVINALLKIRGDAGKLATSIQVWEDGGRRIDAGKDFFVVFSTNPPGKGFNDRFPVDKALARALVWVNLPDRLSDESMRKATGKICTFEHIPPGDGTIIDLRKHEELAQTVGEVLAKFHKIYVEMLQDGEPGRQQKTPATIDSLWRAAKLIQGVQLPTENFKSLDMLGTLRKAVQGVYINALQNKPGILPGTQLKDAKTNSLGQQLLDALDKILTNRTTELVHFRGTPATRAEKLATLTGEAITASDGEREGTTSTHDVTQAAQDRVEEKKMVADLIQIRANVPPADFRAFLKAALGGLTTELANNIREALNGSKK